MKEDVIKGFKIGADDYLIKPFDSEILLFKIKSIFKRKISFKKATDNKVDYIFSSFRYNSKFRELQFKNDKPVTLSPKEGKLLTLLLDNMNDLTTREEALVKIFWNLVHPSQIFAKIVIFVPKSPLSTCIFKS